MVIFFVKKNLIQCTYMYISRVILLG